MFQVDCTLKARLGFVYVEASLVCPSKGAFPGTDSNGIVVKILLLKPPLHDVSVPSVPVTAVTEPATVSVPLPVRPALPYR